MHVQDKDLVTTLSTQEAPLSAAVYARRDTPLGGARWLGPLGNYLVVRPAARVAAHKDAERTDMPLDAAVVLGLGRTHLHVWSADPMLSTVGEHLGAVELDRLASVETDIAKSWAPLVLTFSDGEALELQARGDVGGFARAFETIAR
jgi:hypothetical protein